MKIRVIVDGQPFSVEVGDLSARPISVQVDGEAFDVWPEEDGKVAAAAAAAVEAAQAMAAPAVTPLGSVRPMDDRTTGARLANKAKVVPAPIPGVILSVAVKEGDSVVFGQELCVLEAMKMKNIIRANRAGKIGRVCVAGGDQVKHNQMLLEYSD